MSKTENVTKPILEVTVEIDGITPPVSKLPGQIGVCIRTGGCYRQAYLYRATDGGYWGSIEMVDGLRALIDDCVYEWDARNAAWIPIFE